jgi:hypothetical protein
VLHTIQRRVRFSVDVQGPPTCQLSSDAVVFLAHISHKMRAFAWLSALHLILQATASASTKIPIEWNIYKGKGFSVRTQRTHPDLCEGEPGTSGYVDWGMDYCPENFVPFSASWTKFNIVQKITIICSSGLSKVEVIRRKILLFYGLPGNYGSSMICPTCYYIRISTDPCFSQRTWRLKYCIWCVG